MGPFQRLLQRICIPGEPPVDRRRKEMVAVGLLAGIVFLVVGAFGLLSADGLEGSKRTGQRVLSGGALMAAAALLPAAAYVFWTRKVSVQLCEATVYMCALATAVADVGALLRHLCDTTSFIVLALDAFLACDCRDSAARSVVIMFALWVMVREALRTENVADNPCFEHSARFSVGYFSDIAAGGVDMMIVAVDFHITRGFAKSMKEQKSLVEASIQVSELAAVRLSRYETDATQELLEGAEGEGLPDGLRRALLQLVANLAQYRPYLPQCCLPSVTSDSASASTATDADESGAAAADVQTPVRSGSDPEAAAESTGLSATHSFTSSVVSEPLVQPIKALSTFARLGRDARRKRVSVAAVNSKGFLSTSQPSDSAALARYLGAEVEVFNGAVAAEHGLVDLVSGDHLFANFNASRMCTTHRVSAARTVWSMCGDSAVAHAERVCRTGTACSGQALCGDFGTSELRRFMVVGAAASTLQCLERVAAQLRTALVDDAVGGDADVASGFFTALVERVRYSKRGPKPFLVWQLAGRREECKDPSEWMYELEQQAPNPYEEWNTRIASWLGFGEVYGSEQPAAVPAAAAAERVAGARQQSELVEAAVVGGTVALQFLSADA